MGTAPLIFFQFDTPARGKWVRLVKLLGEFPLSLESTAFGRGKQQGADRPQNNAQPSGKLTPVFHTRSSRGHDLDASSPKS